MFRTLCVASAVLLQAASFAAPAGAETIDLFRVATPAEAQARGGAGPGRPDATRERLVTLDAPTDRTAAARRAGDGAPSYRIRLFPDADAVFAPIDEEPTDDGGSIWNGSSESGGEATLVTAPDGGVTGRVILKSRVYRIEPQGGTTHRILELDRTKSRPFGPHVHAPTVRASKSAPPEPPAGKTEVTALFVYTERAKKNSSNIKSDIELAVALTNRAYKASSVKIKLKLVGTMLVEGYNENKRSYNQVLNDVTDQSGSGKAFKPVGKRRNQEKADLVALVREGGEYCGLAWAVDEPNKDSAGYGYSEMSRDCVDYDVAAHELGHNMGLLHDRYIEPKAPKSQYNFGYVNLSKRVRDIMSYSSRCDDSGVSCEQLTRFSNPDDKIKGQPFGAEKGQSGASDGARRLNETRAGVASYR